METLTLSDLFAVLPYNVCLWRTQYGFSIAKRTISKELDPEMTFSTANELEAYCIKTFNLQPKKDVVTVPVD